MKKGKHKEQERKITFVCIKCRQEIFDPLYTKSTWPELVCYSCSNEIYELEIKRGQLDKSDLYLWLLAFTDATEAELAKMLAVSRTTLYRWRCQYKADPGALSSLVESLRAQESKQQRYNRISRQAYACEVASDGDGGCDHE